MALSADNTVIPGTMVVPSDGAIMEYPVALTTVIYKNSFVALNASGYLVQAVSATAASAASGAAPNGNRFIGIALEHITSQTANGDATCKTVIDGYFEYTLTTAVTDVGMPVFLSDDNTITKTARTGQCIGYIAQRADASNAVIKLDPFHALDTGKLLSVSSAAISFATTGNKVLLVHESQNPTGLLLCTCSAYMTVAMVSSADTTPDITIQHTEDTTLGCILTGADNDAIGESIVGVGGQMWAPASASSDTIILVPAGKQVNAEVTDPADESSSEAGSCVIVATFMRI